MSKKIGNAHANPTKAFFVRMITRDISLEDCIFDLIDNSVDAAKKLAKAGTPTFRSPAKLGGYWIDIRFSAAEFRISDNCGGISFDDAVAYAFTFGRREEDAPDKYGIGVYGIGMKRAVFKMGSNVIVRSTFGQGKKRESYRVVVNVEEWLANDSAVWDFDIEEDEELDEPGVEVSVSDLNGPTQSSFLNPAFHQQIRRDIARDYSFLLHHGLSIHVNGKPIRGWEAKFLQSDELKPAFLDYTEHVESADARQVNIEIVAGAYEKPSDASDPEEDTKFDDQSGWFVVCNGRVVLAADKTNLTGWGLNGMPKWHPQYSGFMGFVFFSSENAADLPLTTTKRSVDRSSAMYARALLRMRDITLDWIRYTNARKQALEVAKRKEAAAKPASIYSAEKIAKLELPAVAPQHREPMATIQYAIERKRVRSLAEEFGNRNMSYREVGKRSFEYSFEELVGEE